MGIRGGLVAALLVLACAPAPPAHAQSGGEGDRCLTAPLPPVTAPARPLRFGITPGAAGSAGATQGAVAPEDPAKATAALQGLRPPGRALVLRLNRLFWSDGEAGIRRFAEAADAYGRAGLSTEVQVRYHPPAGGEGDIDAWAGFVRRAVSELSAHPAVSGFSITNEANFPVSQNTSDGAYDGVVDALVRGVAVAREELERTGRPDLPVGFNVAWRYTPDADARFWSEIGAKATPAFRRALSYVGVQIYPGLVWPPAPRPGVPSGDEVVEALTLVRRCYMPKAALGDGVALWVSENGYATNLGRSEPAQAESLDSSVRAVARYSGTLGITDYRWFNLRDNDSDGRDIFDAVGLLRDDYAPKPAYAGYRGLIGLMGRDEPAPGPSPAAGRVRPGLRATVRGAGRRAVTRGRIVVDPGTDRAAACRGTVLVRQKARRRTVSARRVRVRPDCTFASRVRYARRRVRGLRVFVSFGGNAVLLPAATRPRRVR